MADNGDLYSGTGPFKNTGRKSSGYAETMDSLVGVPARTAIAEAQKGNINSDDVTYLAALMSNHGRVDLAKRIFNGDFNPQFLTKVWNSIGSDPQTAPTGFDVASKVTDNPYAGAGLATIIDLAQIPTGGATVLPGALGEVKGVKHAGNIADAMDAFLERGKAPLSTETKIAQMHGTSGEVRDAIDPLLERAKTEYDAATRHKVPLEDVNETWRNGGSRWKSAYDNPRNVPAKPVKQTGEGPLPNQQTRINYLWGKDDTLKGLDQTERTELAGYIKKYPTYEPSPLKFPDEHEFNQMPRTVEDNVIKEPKFSEAKKYNENLAKEREEYFWNDPNDQRFTDEAKAALQNIHSRYGEDFRISEKLRSAQDSELDHLPYVGQDVTAHPNLQLPNFAARPTGVIGNPTIQGPNTAKTSVPEPFPWMDDKYKAGKQLLSRHKSQGMPVEIHTSSDLISKPDYIAEIPEGSTINMHMLTGNGRLDRILFPGNPSSARLESAAEKLEQAGHKVNRVYPQSGQEVMDKAAKAYGVTEADLLNSVGYGERDALANHLDEELKASAKERAPGLSVAPKPDNYAHGGTVVPHYAGGGEVSWENTIPMATEMPQPGPEAEPTWENTSDPTEKYGGLANQLTAGATGALRGATLGASDYLLTKSGLAKPEDLAGLQRENPWTSVGGELTGAIGSLAIPSSPASLIGKAGKAVYGGTKALAAAKIAQDGSLAAKILGGAAEVGATAAGSAVEGALYTGIGSSITEHSLGETKVNAEKVLANVGYGALLGGALGGVLKSAEIGIPESLKAAKEGLTTIRNKIFGSGAGDEGIITPLLDKIDPEMKLSSAMSRRATNLDVDQKAKLVSDTTDMLNTVQKNIDTTTKTLNADIRPLERDALIDTAAPLQTVRDARQEIITSIDNAVELIKSEPHIYAQGPGRELELHRLGLVENLAKDKTPAQIMDRLTTLKQSLQNIVYDKMSAASSKARDVIEGISGQVRDVLHNPDIFGVAGASQAAHDSMLSDLYQFVSPNARRPTEFQKIFMKRLGSGPKARWDFDAGKVERVLKNSAEPKGQRSIDLLDQYFETLKKLPDHLENTIANVPNARMDPSRLAGFLENAHGDVGLAQTKYQDAIQNMKGRRLGMGDFLAGTIATTHPVIGAAVEAYNIASKPIEYINKLAEIERMIGKTTNMVGSGAKSIFKPAIRGVAKTRGVFGKEISKDRHEEIKESLPDINNEPMRLTDMLSQATEHLSSVAPEMAQSMQLTTALAVQFLHSKLPDKPQLSPFDDKYEPSNSEIHDFNNYYSIINKPTLALDQVREGTLTPETVEALGAVYPSLYSQMKQAVLEEASKVLARKETIPYQTKQTLSLFLQQPIDQSFSGASIQANQMAFQPPPQQQAGKSPKEGRNDLTLANRTGINHGKMEES